MNERIKHSLVFVCLNEAFGEKVSKNFADLLSMHFVSCKELVEYDLFSSGAVLKECGEEYYLMREGQAVVHACSFENSVIFSNFDIFFHNKDIFLQSCTVVYLNLAKKLLDSNDVLSALNFTSRDLQLKKYCDLKIEISKLNEKSALRQIIKVLGGIE